MTAPFRRFPSQSGWITSAQNATAAATIAQNTDATTAMPHRRAKPSLKSSSITGPPPSAVAVPATVC